MTGGGFLSVEGLSRAFAGRVAVDGVSLEVRRGEILALLGPSGSGKTTTLRLLAGFETPDAGRIAVDGEDVTGLRPEARRFGMVFQHYALFPHLDVGENVAFGLARRGAARERRVAEALAMVDLAGAERRAVSELSGGQQQRVALARSLAPEPRVLLLDEPLSNLDPSLRERTRRELRGAIRRAGITTVFVTHEQEEAFDLGDRVAVLHAGRLEQVGTPDELYESPATAFVARFIGRTSAIPGALAGGAADSTALVRPEELRFVADAGAALQGTVVERRFTGERAHFLVEAADGLAFEVLAPHGAARVGDVVRAAVGRVLFWEGTRAQGHGGAA